MDFFGGNGEWMRVHTTERRQLFVPMAEAAEHGPNLDELGPHRITQVLFGDGTRLCYEDKWRGDTARLVLPKEWTGVTWFTHVTPPSGAGDEAPTFEPRTSVAPDEIDRSKPWSGELPPQPLDGDINPSTFIRNKSGVWCRPDASGRVFPVDRVGERWSKKPLKTGGEARPPELSAHFWHNVLSSKERKQYWKEKRALLRRLQRVCMRGRS